MSEAQEVREKVWFASKDGKREVVRFPDDMQDRIREAFRGSGYVLSMEERWYKVRATND